MRTPILAAVLVLLATACGDSGESEPAPTAAAPATSATVTTAPAPPATTSTTTVPPANTDVTTTTSVTATAVPTTVPAPTEWAQLDPGGSGPAARSNPVLAFDPVAEAVYLHGGRAGGDSLADLWRYDLTTGTWTELTPAGDGPEPRFSHTAIWDVRRNRLVIFSGEGRGFGDFFSDVWAYDPVAGAWAELAADGAGPANRYGSCAGYDEVGDRFLITHGFTDDGRFDDTWAYSLADNTWTEVTPSGQRPGARCLHACAYEMTSGALVMFGGQDDDVPFLDDTWVLGAGGWQQGAPGPSARKFPITATLPGSVLLFGGIGFDGETADTWRYSSADLSWTPVEPAASPPARESHGAAADTARSRVFVFGGRGDDGELADLWVYSTST